jgi:hypothetical protein
MSLHTAMRSQPKKNATMMIFQQGNLPNGLPHFHEDML